MIKLNLLPDIKREYLKAKRVEARAIALSILVGLFAIGLLVLLGVYVYLGQQILISMQTDSIKKNVKTLEEQKDVEKYLTLQSQLANIDSLHHDKSNFSRLLDIVPKLNPKAPNDISLGEMVIDSELGTLSLSGTAKDYTGLITYRDTLQNTKLKYTTKDSAEVKSEDMFPKVYVEQQGLTRDNEGKEMLPFKITVEYNKQAFATSSTSVEVVVPVIDTTPSRQGAPTGGSN